MSAVEARLAELGLSLPAVVPPLAAYQPAVQWGVYVYTSGQLPMVDGKLPVTGKVGAEVTAEEAKELARTCALNALAAVKSVAGDLDRVAVS
ncbi:RidA family protein OS=Streptomyces alboniger OX=132473 GN=CP975_19230 PE=4 SV=1 [Streptomyces alboniger]